MDGVMLRAWRFLWPHRHLGDQPEVRVALVDEAYRKVFASEDGAVVLGEILKDSGLFAPCPKGAPNSELARAEGARELAIIIFQRAGYDPDLLAAASVRDNLLKAQQRVDHHERHEHSDHWHGDHEPDFGHEGDPGGLGGDA